MTGPVPRVRVWAHGMSEGLAYYVLPDDPVEALTILREAAGSVSEPKVAV